MYNFRIIFQNSFKKKTQQNSDAQFINLNLTTFYIIRSNERRTLNCKRLTIFSVTRDR